MLRRKASSNISVCVLFTFNSFWDASAILSHPSLWRYYALSIPSGMLRISLPFRAWGDPELSIPSGMLRIVNGAFYDVVQTHTFNSFWDASGTTPEDAVEKAADFQFLLGCFVVWGCGSTAEDAVFQFLLGCFRLLEVQELQSELNNFQFLLGCFFITFRIWRWLFSCIELNNFQFLLGCFTKCTWQESQWGNELSIPSGMLQQGS